MTRFRAALLSLLSFCLTHPAVSQTCSSATLASFGSVQITAVDQDATHIYFGDANGIVRRVAKAGGSAETLSTENNAIGGVAVDDSKVYYAVNRLSGSSSIAGATEIRSVPKSGGASVKLAGGLDLVSDVRIDATHVYYVVVGSQNGVGFFNAGGSAQRVAKAGGTPDVLASGLAGGSILMALDGNDVYFGEQGGAFGFPSGPHGVRRVSKSGGAVAHISEDQPVYELFVDANNVYTSSGFGAAIGVSDGVFRVSKSGGTSTQIVGPQSFTMLTGVDNGTVYVASDNNCGPSGWLGTVAANATGITNPTHIADNLACGVSYRVLFDGCAIYGAPRGSIARFCKPNCTASSSGRRRPSRP